MLDETAASPPAAVPRSDRIHESFVHLSVLCVYLLPLTAFTIPATCSGVEPQQPPTTRAPNSTYFFAYSPISSGVTSYTAVSVSASMRGRPALGLAHNGKSGMVLAYSVMMYSMFSSVVPQFAPTRSAPFSAKVLITSVGLTPIMVRSPRS